MPFSGGGSRGAGSGSGEKAALLSSPVGSVGGPSVAYQSTDAEFDYQSLETVPDAHGYDVSAGGSVNNSYSPEDGRKSSSSNIEEVKPAGTAGLFSSTFNLSKTAIGAGTLAIPSAVAQAGLGMGLVILVLSGACAGFSGNLLMACTRFCDGLSYKELAGLSLGRNGERAVEVALILLTFGACAGYMVVINNMVVPISHFFLGTERTAWFLDGRFVLGAVTLLAVLPLSLLKRLHALRYTSVAALVCLLYLAGLIMWRSIGAMGSGAVRLGDEGQTILWAHAKAETLNALPLTTLAFTFHMNLAPLYEEMKTPTIGRMQTVINSTIAIGVFFYSVIGVFGYLLFFAATNSNILTNFDQHQDVFVLLANIGILVVTAFSFPLVHYPCRQNLLTLFFCGSENPVLYVALTVIVVALCYGIAIIPGVSLGLVFGILGSTAGIALVFSLPALFFVRLSPFSYRESPKKVLALALLVSSLLLSGLCMYAVIVSPGSS